MKNITPQEDLPIWQKEALFPVKPDSFPYGYMTYKGNAVGTQTISELKQAFYKEQDRVYGAWRPEQKRVMPVAEVTELLDELRPKRIHDSAANLKSSRLIVIIFLGVLGFIGLRGFQNFGWKFYEDQSFAMVGIMAVMFGFSPFYEAWKSHRAAKNLSVKTLAEEAREVRFEVWMSRQKGFFTRVLCFILVGISIVQVMKGGQNGGGFHKTAELAGLKNKLDLNGEYWRLWTAPFLHGGLIHIFFNASGLWYLGKRVEVLAKWPHFLMAFISSALFGSFCSIHFLPRGVEGIGASGGIMGLLGFLLTFELMHPKLSPKPARRRLIAAIGIMFIIGLVGVSFIDNAAHAGGLLAGATYAILTFQKSDSAKRPELHNVDWILGIGALALIIWSILLTYSKIA